MSFNSRPHREHRRFEEALVCGGVVGCEAAFSIKRAASGGACVGVFRDTPRNSFDQNGIASSIEIARKNRGNPAAIERLIPNDGTWPEGFHESDFSLPIATGSAPNISQTTMGAMLLKRFKQGGGNA